MTKPNKKKPKKKKNLFNQDEKVLQSKKKVNSLLSKKRDIDRNLHDNMKKIMEIQNTLDEDLSEQLSLKSLHDLHAVKNNQTTNNPTKVLHEIVQLRHKQYKDVKSLFDVADEIKIAEIDLALSKIKCIQKQLNDTAESSQATIPNYESLIENALTKIKELNKDS